MPDGAEEAGWATILLGVKRGCGGWRVQTPDFASKSSGAAVVCLGSRPFTVYRRLCRRLVHCHKCHLELLCFVASKTAKYVTFCIMEIVYT